MARPGKINEIERREGKPIADILIAAYETHGSQTEVAKALGVGQSTISLWLIRLGLQEKTVLVPRKKDKHRSAHPTTSYPATIAATRV